MLKKTLLKGSMVLLLLVVLAGCSLPGLASTTKETIKIGALGTSESQILAELLSIMIERETDASTELVTHLGSSIVQHQGMLRGDLDITSTRYTWHGPDYRSRESAGHCNKGIPGPI